MASEAHHALGVPDVEAVVDVVAADVAVMVVEAAVVDVAAVEVAAAHQVQGTPVAATEHQCPMGATAAMMEEAVEV